MFLVIFIYSLIGSNTTKTTETVFSSMDLALEAKRTFEADREEDTDECRVMIEEIPAV